MKFPFVYSINVGLLVSCFAFSAPSILHCENLKDHEIELSEAKLALNANLAESAQLQQKLRESDAALGRVQAALVIAKAESEEFRRKAGELRLRIEALGVDTAGGNLGKLEQRLLKSVSDLKIAQDESQSLKESLIKLAEAVMASQKMTGSIDADTRLFLEAGLRGANKVLGGFSSNVGEPTPIPSSMIDGMVISMKDDLSLVVANIGSNQGVKIGMPFNVVRGEKAIGNVRVIDVREKISGAVIQNLSADSLRVEVGDRLTVMAQKPQR